MEEMLEGHGTISRLNNAERNARAFGTLRRESVSTAAGSARLPLEAALHSISAQRPDSTPHQLLRLLISSEKSERKAPTSCCVSSLQDNTQHHQMVLTFFAMG
ncbi:hypothetical protein SKAU_G00311100 [Synaphobranchus kaupii]|uniref:Uncharacterized protein n=1 Tax=Synaphobranchus kaupii TaxID=118154 RepID=A0A9Q1IKA8_SYNKA|nr:hypothetical protein SKAU_G00311100 [Synaphobranchus kaupii]